MGPNQKADRVSLRRLRDGSALPTSNPPVSAIVTRIAVGSSAAGVVHEVDKPGPLVLTNLRGLHGSASTTRAVLVSTCARRRPSEPHGA